MASPYNNPRDLISALPEERKLAVTRLHETILQHLPQGFESGISYGMISYHVPHKLYPNGYHVDPSQPLPFMNLASQKNHIALYHMGIYSNPGLLAWFEQEYSKQVAAKLDMGKSCIRFKNTNKIPYELIGQLASKMTVAEWISTYKAQLKI